MRRILALAFVSALALPLVGRADSLVVTGSTSTNVPAGLNQTATAVASQNFTFIADTGVIDFTFAPTETGSGSEDFSFVLSITGSFGTETITQDGTLSFSYFEPGFVGSSYSPTTQTITGTDAYSAVFTYDFDSGYPSGQTSTLYAEAYPAPVVTPEPGTLLLLGTGLAGLVGAARRRLA